MNENRKIHQLTEDDFAIERWISEGNPNGSEVSVEPTTELRAASVGESTSGIAAEFKCS